jgi:lysophospholipid acyltransferase (LPLAT)-like uncharacterized protein
MSFDSDPSTSSKPHSTDRTDSRTNATGQKPEAAPAAGQRSLKFELTMWALYIFCRLLSATWRIRVVGMDQRRRALAASRTKGLLIASFHENAAAGVLSHQGQPICQMISRSKDGEIVAFIAQRMGFQAIRGSSSRGAKDARDEMVAAVRTGLIGAITVDGPRGPRRILKNGIIDIARKTGAPVLPTTCVGSSMWILRKTWDQTRIPKPFARLIVHYGEPIFIPDSINNEQFGDYTTKVKAALEQNDDRVRLRFEELWAI